MLVRRSNMEYIVLFVSLLIVAIVGVKISEFFNKNGH